MVTLKTYTRDLEIARAILMRDGMVTREYMYIKCYPLFKSIYDNYFTDSTCVKEFIDDIYVLIMTPSKLTGKCQLENFCGGSTLTSWLKTVCLYYCYNKFEQKERMPLYEPLSIQNEDIDEDSSDRWEAIYGSIDIDFSNLNKHDALVILNMMPNKRYSKIIKLRYLELKSNEETAETLGMTMENYYNKHKLAKEQYVRILRKEVQHG